MRGLARRIFHRLRKKDSPVTEIWTEHMSWLTFANAGMLNKANVYCFDYGLRNLPSDTSILEIGSFCGLSTNMIGHLKEKHQIKNPFFTCDKWIFEGATSSGNIGDSDSISHTEYREFVKETFIRNVRFFSRRDLPFTIELFSDEFFESWAAGEKRVDVFGRDCQLGGAIGFCYIDGNHSYEFAKRDFENVDKFLEKNGFILFDDSSDGSGWGVCEVVQEILAAGRYELVSRNPNYFFKKLA